MCSVAVAGVVRAGVLAIDGSAWLALTSVGELSRSNFVNNLVMLKVRTPGVEPRCEVYCLNTSEAAGHLMVWGRWGSW